MPTPALIRELGQTTDLQTSAEETSDARSRHILDAGLAYHAGEYERALREIDAALALQPGDADGFYNRGIVLGQLDRPAEALEAFRRATELRPSNARAQYNAGVALGQLGRFDEAVEAYECAVALDPDMVEPRYNLGATLARLNRWQDAARVFEHAVERWPDHLGIRKARAAVLKRLLRGLVSGGPEAWMGRKPVGAERPLIVKPGFPTVSETLLRDRR
jgi:tetratricopeptide (TPR) repeat protein